jgi:periplasmic divalent cation tolerance protein
MDQPIVVMTTVETRNDGEKIARKLLEKRLCGCVQLEGPLQSFYWWQDKIEQAEEFRLQVKSDQSCYDRLEQAIMEAHPYDVPEIICLPIISISREYGRWLNEELARD